MRHVRVWRFSLYYVAVFGSYVALSAWLPKSDIDNFQVSLTTAGLLTAMFIFPASLLPPTFADTKQWSGFPTPTFFVLFLLTLICAVWMHVVIHRMHERYAPHIARDIDDHAALAPISPS